MIRHLKFVPGLLALLAPLAVAAGPVVVDFERATPGTWIRSWKEQGVVCHLAWEPTKSKAPGRMTVFPHLATQRKGILCAMADEPIPVQVDFPQPATSVTVVFWASNGCAAVLEGLDAAGHVVDTARLPVAPARAAPGDPVPFFELTVAAPAMVSVRFSGPRAGEFLAADEVRITPAGAPSR
jgi:hypothetical protein